MMEMLNLGSIQDPDHTLNLMVVRVTHSRLLRSLHYIVFFLWLTVNNPGSHEPLLTYVIAVFMPLFS